MRLQEYLAINHISRADFARKVDVSVESVRRYLTGRVPETSVMSKIIEVTEGKVTANDFFDLPDEAEAA
jgi:transcriptional regulator with XRE-family HTH domain